MPLWDMAPMSPYNTPEERAAVDASIARTEARLAKARLLRERDPELADRLLRGDRTALEQAEEFYRQLDHKAASVAV